MATRLTYLLLILTDNLKLSILMFLVGLIMVIVVGAIKLKAIIMGYRAPLIANSPYFYLAMLSMVLGTQFFVTGFLGELIARSSNERNKYQIQTTIDK